MTETNPKFYIAADGYAQPFWPKTTPEEMIEEGNTLWDAVILIGAAGMVVAFFVAVFWIVSILEYLLT